MDKAHFDELTRRLGGAISRRALARDLVAAVVALRGAVDLEADASARVGARQKKKRCPASRQCEAGCCPRRRVCCDPTSLTCCAKGDECCNVGPGTGSCCRRPNRCGVPYGQDAAPQDCCPPERQWLTTTGIVRCCPEGTRSLGTGVSTNGGPCCPDAAYCGGACCAAGSVCVDPASQRCCAPEQVCGASCCAGGDCCNGECCPSAQSCWGCVGGACQYLCGGNQYCTSGVCKDCGPYGCGG
jgi:hypothetical protein